MKISTRTARRVTVFAAPIAAVLLLGAAATAGAADRDATSTDQSQRSVAVKATPLQPGQTLDSGSKEGGPLKTAPGAGNNTDVPEPGTSSTATKPTLIPGQPAPQNGEPLILADSTDAL